MAKKNRGADIYQRLAAFFFEVGTLRKTMRSHRQTLLTNDLSDNIAAHSFRVAWIGWCLAKLEKADCAKVVMMCLLHDLEEARGGDQNWVHKKYVRVFDCEIAKDQLGTLPMGPELLALDREYTARRTLESKVAKDADLLDQVLLQLEYAWQGNREAQRWVKGREQERHMFTASAKKLAVQARRQEPNYWWRHLWTAKRR